VILCGIFLAGKEMCSFLFLFAGRIAVDLIRFFDIVQLFGTSLFED